MVSRCLLRATAALGAAVAAWGCGVLPAAAAATKPVAAPVSVMSLASRAHSKSVGPCSWSYFGDPRVLAYRQTVFTGCISTRGEVVVERLDTATGRARRFVLYRGMEVDDHNNPSLVMFKDRLYVFSAPHSGYVYPLDGRKFLRYRVSRRAHGLRGGFGPSLRVPLDRGCHLGYTYPNPVVAGGRLYVFLRGPCWEPYYTWTVDGRHWAPARTLFRGPGKNRPYAKYAAGPDGSIHILLSDGHPHSHHTSLYYVHMKHGRFYSADGRLLGAIGDLPLHTSSLPAVYRYQSAREPAWPQDVAVDHDGHPVVVYTRTVSRTDWYHYTVWNGHRWVDHTVVSAGHGGGSHGFHTGGMPGYSDGGATLNHDDPNWLVLARRIGSWNQIELRHTDDAGSTWTAAMLTNGTRGFSIRPVFARGWHSTRRLIIGYVTGTAHSFRDYQTTVRLLPNITPRLTTPTETEPTR